MEGINENDDNKKKKKNEENECIIERETDSRDFEKYKSDPLWHMHGCGDQQIIQAN